MFDHPLEQSANNPDQVIETSRSCTCSAQEECVDGSWGNLGKGHDPRGVQIAIEHSQHLVLDIVPPVQGSLVADKSDDMWVRSGSMDRETGASLQLLPIAESHFAERVDLDLCIDHCRRRGPMPHIIAYRLERKAAVHQPLDAGIPQRMGSWARYGDACLVQILAGNARHCRMSQWRSRRKVTPEKHPALRIGPAVLQIVDDDLADDRRQ